MTGTRMNCHGGGREGGETGFGLDICGTIMKSDGIYFQHACKTGGSCCLLFKKKNNNNCLSFHILISLAAFVAFTLPYHRFAYCTGLQCMTNYNVDFLPALVCCNICTVIVKSQASVVGKKWKNCKCSERVQWYWLNLFSFFPNKAVEFSVKRQEAQEV